MLPRGRNGSTSNKNEATEYQEGAECHQAPWVPAVSENITVAKAASAEEETAADESDAAPAEEAEASPEEASDENPAEAAAEEAVAPEPDLSYLDSFKADAGGQEIGVNFENLAGHHAFVSNFDPIAKSDCTRCHVASKAGDSCLVCHNYHIRPKDPTMGVQSLRDLIAQKTGATASE